MISSPMQPTRRYGLGTANLHTGERVVITRAHKCRREAAELLGALLARHPHETIYVAKAQCQHEDDVVEAVLRGAAGRLVLLYLPT